MKILAFLLSVMLLGGSQTEKFYVIKVKGEITNLTTGKLVEKGDEILLTDQFEFKNKRSYAIVIGDQKGRYEMKFPQKSDIASRTYVAIGKESLIKKNRARYNTRSIYTNAPINNLKVFLGEDEFTVIGNSLDVKLSKNKFINQSIVAKFEKKGEQVDKNIVNEEYVLQLSRNSLGVKSSGEVKLYHVDFVKKASTASVEEKITRLDVNFIDKNIIQDELETIIGVYKKKNYTKPQMKQFLMEYFSDFYGNTHMYSLSKFVDEIIKKNME